MAYLLVLVGLAGWATVALRDRPFLLYAAIFFTCALIAIPAEVTTLRLLNVYEWQMRLLTDQKADVMVASIIIAWLNPLLGTLYARYCQPKPILKACLSSIALGRFESHIITRIPHWPHLLGFTIWFSLMIDIPLQGICWLWQSQISFFGDTVRDNRLFSATPNFLLLTPSTSR